MVTAWPEPSSGSRDGTVVVGTMATDVVAGVVLVEPVVEVVVPVGAVALGEAAVYPAAPPTTIRATTTTDVIARCGPDLRRTCR
jgi:hypothetical protein